MVDKTTLLLYLVIFINNNGEFITDMKFDKVQNFQGGLTVVQKSRKWGIMNNSGELVTYLKYDRVKNIGEGLVAVYTRKEGNKWALINESGKPITDFEFQVVRNVYEGLSVVKRGNQWGVIRKTAP